MSFADWVMVAAILLSAILAASQGFFYEVFSLAGTVVGYLVASWQYQRTAAWFRPHVSSDWVANIMGFLILFIAIVLVAGLVAKLSRWLMKEVGLSWLDRILGALFGILRGALTVAIVLMAMTSFTPDSPWLAESTMAPYFLVVGRAAVWLAPSDLRGHFYKGLDILHGAHP